MSLEQIIYLLFIIFLLFSLYVKSKKIEHLEARIKQLSARSSGDGSEDERLLYLRNHLAELDKVKAIKALRKRYPELSLIEANELWQQR
ncbi:hypothetical protein [Psychrobacter sp. FDAARGOS_221]|uniref:hypothetical protein n=1 Tax=Psychrobacter sp. FDAARGOS_221 TaxID=1975705 RepID=UPI000BB559D7|nr:hypothetical protein [Psychrobacter sp. FDAARGOS_221]PNK61110.1 hypothetical protein A6J60_009640 [Psychrobacter sp. FDAARGOS_221]